MSTITVTNTAMLTQALNSAHSGDTIQLAAGTYSGLKISNVNIPGGVTITSLDPAHKAMVTNFSVANSSGLNFSNLEFLANGAANGADFLVSGSQNISFSNDVFHGVSNTNLAIDADGLGIGGSSNISITNSEFYGLGHGAIIGSSSNVTVSGNTFHDIKVHGLDFSEVHGVTVSNNSFTNFYPGAIDHPDAIIFFTYGGAKASSDIVVDGNVVTRGVGAAIQGIFMRDVTGTQPFQNVTISNNTLVGTGYNGIAVEGGHNVTVTGNTVQSFTGGSNLSWIRLLNVDTASLTHNAAETFLNTSVTNLTQSQNIINTPIANTPATQALAVTTAMAVHAPLGNDVFHVTHSTDVITVAPGTPNETVMTTVSYHLPANVQNMIATGTAAVSLVGNSMDNVLTANSGSDTLTGGAGNDTFVFAPGQKIETITDFKANGDHDRIDIGAYIHAGQTASFVQHGSYSSVVFSDGHTINVLGVHAADMHVSGNYIV